MADRYHSFITVLRRPNISLSYSPSYSTPFVSTTLLPASQNRSGAWRSVDYRCCRSLGHLKAGRKLVCPPLSTECHLKLRNWAEDWVVLTGLARPELDQNSTACSQAPLLIFCHHTLERPSTHCSKINVLNDLPYCAQT
ncbi:hypothetical protein F5X98DRAFT_90492 [Xylaria grammica]|nr:hypothetical protein F5X98DRAFT_90492 [Xylaria grammica]